MNAPMSTQKMEIARRKSQKNLNEKINKLLKELRKSHSSCNNSNNIVLDTSVDLHNFSKKHKLSYDSLERNAKKIKCESYNENDDVVVVTDESHLVTNDFFRSTKTPKKIASVYCSTPLINHNNKPIHELNFSNLSQHRNSSNMQINKIIDLTEDFKNESLYTIDLTAGTKSPCDTVIDLENTTDTQDCKFVSASNMESMSGDSDVTVLSKSECKRSNEEQMKQIVDGIAKLDATEKGKLLELITQKIFSGCQVPYRLKKRLSNINEDCSSQNTNTVENTYIKEVILGQTNSRNSIGSNIYNPEKDFKKNGLRMVIIDGSNVAMQHGKGKIFSVKGLKICIDYFINRGHVVKAFVPHFRCKFGKSSEPRLLDELERHGLVVYTPCREIQGRMITSYDDRYIVQCAAEFDGVIVSGDNYRDLLKENPRWRCVIENRVLPFTWVDDMIMFPRDPLGRNGPTLEHFLRHPPEKTK